MAKPLASVYLDTNIFSVLYYSGGHVESLAQHLKTRDWWRTERSLLRIFSSQWTVNELTEGVYESQAEAIAAARRLPFLTKSAAVNRCAELYLQKGIVPPGKLGDSIQLALATVHGMDYLLTWNYAHLANAHIQHRLENLHRGMGWRTPWLVSPDTIPWHSLSQDVRRGEE
jgi:hypothetical protein